MSEETMSKLFLDFSTLSPSYFASSSLFKMIFSS